MARSPLFDVFDPYGLATRRQDFSPIGVVPLDGDPRIEDLMDEEEQASMLQNLAYAGSSGLTGIGWLLDTPGSMVRGLLSEGPMKALSALWETSDERVTGRELARQYGFADKKDTWANFGGGLAAEVLLDPLTYASLGLAPLLGGVAKTGAGKLAQRSGILAQDLGLAAKQLGLPGKATLMRKSAREVAETLPQGLRDEALQRFRDLAGDQADELLNAPMSAGNRISVPFLYEGATDLFGKRAGEFMAKAADNLGVAASAAPVLGPAIRRAQALFDSKRMGFGTESGQWFGRELTQAQEFASEPANRALAEALVTAQRGVGDEVFRTQEFGDAFRNFAEGYPELIPDNLKPLFEVGQPGEALARQWNLWKDEAVRSARKRGIKLEPVKNLPNDIQYLFRQAVKVDNPRMAQDFDVPTDIGYDTATDLLGLGTGTRGRRDYTSGLPSFVLNRMAQDGTLQDALRQATASSGDTRRILDEWFQAKAPEFMQRLGGAGPYDYLINRVPQGSYEELLEAQRRVDKNYSELADRLRRMPLQFAEQKLPFFGNPLNDLQQYVRSRARGEATADVVLKRIGQGAQQVAARNVPGETSFSLSEALKELGFDTKVRRKQVYSSGEMALAKAMGVDPKDLAGMSVPKQFIQEMQTKVRRARTPREAAPLVKAYDQYFLQPFKSLALLWPSRYTRDMYSGTFASATQDAADPLLRDQFRGAAIGRGSYDSIPKMVRDLPDYKRMAARYSGDPAAMNALRNSSPRFKNYTDEQLIDELMIRKFLSDSGGQALTSASVVDDLGRQAANLSFREAAPGMAGPYLQGLRDKINPRSWDFWNIFANRTREGNPNPLLDLGDRAAQASDNFNRIGAYVNRIRKGDSPRAAKAIADLTQVNYRPEAFTEFEREVVKRLVPFYSYTKGITPLVADNLINKPAGLMGQSIRFVNRAGEPSEDRFVPEYLRQSAAIPIDAGLPFLGLNTPGVSRFLTNIDLPHEGLLNLFTPGLGNNLTDKLINTITKTGQNLLGQTSPLIKAPLEVATDRQFYSGRQLSDLYSVAEELGLPGGRLLDQLAFNFPGGSRVIGAGRQLFDQRISLPERLAKFGVNALTGVKLQDVDQARTERLAARSALNELLRQSKGVSVYENLSLKEEDLMKLSPQEKRQYLLYRVLQSRAAREARERKKQQAMLDPMQMLGVR